MGHQIFVIAKTQSCYRVLAAVKHRRLHGASALKVCLRLRDIFQATENRLALEHELHWAKEHEIDWYFWERWTPANLNQPFPFILTCLLLGASFNPIEGYYYDVKIKPFILDIGADDVNSITTIDTSVFEMTVLDITRLDHIRYGFIPCSSNYLLPPPWLMAPSTAESYLWVCYEETREKIKSKHGHLINQFDNWTLISTTCLKSIWPHKQHGKEDSQDSDWSEQGSQDQNPVYSGIVSVGTQNLDITNTEDLGIHVGVSQVEQESPEIDTPESTTENPEIPIFEIEDLDTNQLRPELSRQTAITVALKGLVDAALRLPSYNLHLLNEAGRQPDFYPYVVSRLYSDPDVVFKSSTARQLLKESLEGMETIDLTPFRSLQADQIEEILCGDVAKRSHLTTLNLSGSYWIDKRCLERILKFNPSLRVLHLLDTYRLSLEEKLSVLNGTRVTELYDSELFHGRFQDYDAAFAHEIPTFRSRRPVQMIRVACSVTSANPEETPRYSDGGLDLELLLGEQDSSSFWTTVPLTDVNLLPEVFVDPLGQFVRYFMYHSRPIPPVEGNNVTLATGPVLASSFALTSQGELRNKVNPISRNIHECTTSQKAQKIVPTEWSFVFISEHDIDSPNARPTLRYAFITSADNGPGDRRLVVADMETFLKAVIMGEEAQMTRGQVLDNWKNLVENPNADDPEFRPQLCGKEEIISLMRAIQWQ